jgi:hypothetical protein
MEMDLPVYVAILAGMIIAAGWFGGAINYIFQSKENQLYSYWQCILVGIGAAFIVPFFLTIIQSDLLAKAQSDLLLLFPLAGLCLVAAVIGRRFIETVSDETLKRLNKAEAALEDTQKLVDGGMMASKQMEEVKGAPSQMAAGAPPTEQAQGAAEEVKTEEKASSPLEMWNDLCDKYRRIRQSKPSSNERTREMTALVRRMIDLVPRLEGYPLSERMDKAELHIGQRLGGFIYLYCNPDFNRLSELLRAVQRAEAFGQFWGLQALGKQVEGKQVKDLNSADYRIMEDLLTILKADKWSSDRYYLLYKVMRTLGEERLE